VRAALVLAVASACAFAPRAHAQPAVARPHFVAGTEPRAGGSAFFVPISGEAGAVAITTAHAFPLGDLFRSAEVRFETAATKRSVSVSSRLHAAPGVPFSQAGGRLDGDFLVFALDRPPTGVRTLALCTAACAEVGQRVRILGAPANGSADEDDVFGAIAKAEPGALEVALDVPADLRGWGGAPVLGLPGEEVIGVLEAQWPGDEGLRLGVAPIDRVREAVARPLDAGLGRPFASFRAAPRTAAAVSAAATRSGDAAAAVASAATPEPGDAAVGLGSDSGPLLGRAGALRSELRVSIEHPAENALVSGVEGAFVAGRALALLGEFVRFDVMLVLDTSDSTRAASGGDVNENGVVGEDRVFGVFPTTDAGDSILAAEVAAARRVLESFDPRNTRVGVVTFSGEVLAPPGTFTVGGDGPLPPAITQQALTSDYRLVEKALDRILSRGPEGLTNMTEGVRLAVRELKGFRGGISKADPKSEKVVLFFTDGQPTLPYDNSPQQNVRSVLRAADQARRSRVKIHTFALGPEALDGPVAAVEMARISRGRFTPVRRPGDLIEVIENVDFANLERLTVRNVTLDKPATELTQSADGGFGALVPVAPGKNVLEAWARASDGSEARAQVAVQYVEGAKTPPLPRELVELRNRLLERRIATLRRDRIEAARAQDESVRRQLELEIERERASAEERAAAQRRELRIEPASGEPGEDESAAAP
jgi:hypothetical protein